LNTGRFYLFTLIVITGILAYLSYLIIKPFLTPLAWAVVMTVVFYPIYLYISRFIKWKSFASAITLLIAIILIIGPFSYLLINLASELKDFLHYLNTTGLPKIDELTKSEKVIWIQERIKDTFNIKDLDISSLVSNTLSKIGKAVLSNVTTGVANVASVVINFVLMLFAMFFMLKDGPGFITKVRDYLPFSERQKDRLTSQMKDMVISTIYGGVVVALIQGALGGVTFFLLGLKSPVLLGTAIALMSFVPAFGAVSVWGPVLIYLIVKKLYIKALILFFVGTFIISMVDNFLKPIIISGRTRMPTLFIFFSVIGGIKFFGLIGLVLGPLVIAMFISVVEIFRNLEGGGKNVEP
jgi:predicted PurR-regulated permease PerM